MDKFLERLEEIDNYTYTENDAIALRSTGNKLLDAFGSISAMRSATKQQILDTFYNAYNEDRSLALRLLFYIRDIRGGQGMRQVFRTIARSLAQTHPKDVIDNLDNFLFFGRGDDVLCLLDTPIENEVYDWIANTLQCDIINIEDKGVFPSMLAKWLPSENASSESSKITARKIIKGIKTTPKLYRKMLAKLRAKIGIVETLMSQNRWDEIAFDKLPSKASMIYVDAFMRKANDKYTKYLDELVEGKIKVNAGTLFPVDIISKVYNKKGSEKVNDRVLLDAMWKSLPNYFGDKEETGLCVVDTSGSMYGKPLEVAVSLGMYCADKAKGPFHNHFITFSKNPKLQEIKGDNIFDKVRSIETSQWDMNTNIEKVFALILQTAITNNLNQNELPSKLYIISDMQWDSCIVTNITDSGDLWWKVKVKPETFMDTMKSKYAEHGYTMPTLVYWNVRASECGMFQEGDGANNCCMVSGYSSSLFKSIIEGTEYIQEEVINKDGTKEVITKQKLDPVTVMLTTLNSERYNRVVC